MINISETDKNILIKNIRVIENFPKENISFKDITTLLNKSDVFQILNNHLENRYKDYNLDYIVGLDARGFIFGSILADRLKVGFVPLRKKGKLPSETFSEKYSLEYGFNELEIHKDAFENKKNPRILLIDDLLATGGTAEASEKLIFKANGNCVENCFIIELSSLKGRDKLKSNSYSIIKFE